MRRFYGDPDKAQKECRKEQRDGIAIVGVAQSRPSHPICAEKLMWWESELRGVSLTIWEGKARREGVGISNNVRDEH
ncbi:MAG: hypothetical protein K2M36_05625, partial [Clostridia bacterium]|nr:hypothetical protein [Clostridia bacterium]